MFVEIVKCKSEMAWYRNNVGGVYSVVDYDKDDYQRIGRDGKVIAKLISKEDSKVVTKGYHIGQGK